jgi:hypothetical protein
VSSMAREQIFEEIEADVLKNGPIELEVNNEKWKCQPEGVTRVTSGNKGVIALFYKDLVFVHVIAVPDRVLLKFRTAVRKRGKELQRKRKQFKRLDAEFYVQCEYRKDYVDDAAAIGHLVRIVSDDITFDIIREWGQERGTLIANPTNKSECIGVNWPDPNKHLLWALYDRAAWFTVGTSLQTEIAIETGKTRSYVSAVFQGKRPSKTIEAMIELKVEAFKIMHGSIKWDGK